MEFVNHKRKFKIEVVASVIENTVLTSDVDSIFDFCSFITGETVDLANLYRFDSIIKALVIEQYPTMTRTLPYPTHGDLIEGGVKSLITNYKERFGNEIVIKSIKKDITKRYIKNKR